MKIKKIVITKTEEVYNREWMGVDAKKSQFLSTSEWTQSTDNDLTLESQIMWTYWRLQVRSVNKEIYKTPDEAMAELERLHSSQPEKEYVLEPRMRQMKYAIDISSIESARSDVQRAINHYFINKNNEIFSEGTLVVNTRYTSVLSFMSGNYFDFEHFPLLKSYSSYNNFTVNETVDSILNAFKVLSESMSANDIIRHDLISETLSAESTKQLIQILKKMHGY